MILKAQSSDDGWVYIDGIKNLHVKHVHFEPVPMEVLPQDTPCNEDTESINMFVIEKSEETTRCFVPSETHGCILLHGMYPALEMTMESGEQKNIVISEGYLLNDYGKTIDKFEPYSGGEVGVVLDESVALQATK